MKFKLLCAMLLGLFGNSAVMAADAYCGPTTLEHVLTYRDGSIVIFAPWRNDYTKICNVQTAWKGVSPNTCFAWFSKMSTAVAQQKRIMVFYYDAQSVNCATMPIYDASPAPGYIDLTP